MLQDRGLIRRGATREGLRCITRCRCAYVPFPLPPLRSPWCSPASPVDLVIAAAAEAAGLTVLHYDDDYDRIASITRQPVEWIAPAGSLDR
jgi:predicted nucleic acid-binding protein